MDLFFRKSMEHFRGGGYQSVGNYSRQTGWYHRLVLFSHLGGGMGTTGHGPFFGLFSRMFFPRAVHARLPIPPRLRCRSRSARPSGRSLSALLHWGQSGTSGHWETFSEDCPQSFFLFHFSFCLFCKLNIIRRV